LRKNRSLTFLVFAMFLLAFTFTAKTKVNAEGVPSVSYSVSKSSIYAGDTFSIYVHAQGVSSLYGASIDAALNSNLLEVQSIKKVDIINSFSEVSDLNNLPGIKSYAAMLTGENAGVSASGKIFEIVVRAKTTGTAALKTVNLAGDKLVANSNNINIKLSDNNANPISYSATDYSITIVQAGNWIQNSNGTWSYIKADGSKAVSWFKVDNKWYYFDTNGIMKTNWISDGGKWYYLGTDGAMRTGWQSIGGKWYYLGTDGAMRAGWQSIGGKWYYLGSDGSMRTYWTKVGNEWYYMDGSGAMKTGWLQTGGKWYYLYSDGRMAHDTTIDGKYVLDSNGVWIQ
jgi:hypothetical protein